MKKTHAAYAAQYHRSRRTILRWIEKGYPLDNPAKVAELEAAQKNQGTAREAQTTIIQVDASKLTDEELQNPPTLPHAKLYHLILTCRRLAFANATERALYIHKDEVKAGQMRVCSAVKSMMLGMPGEMPGLLAGKSEAEIQKVLFNRVHEILTELSNPQSSAYQLTGVA